MKTYEQYNKEPQLGDYVIVNVEQLTKHGSWSKKAQDYISKRSFEVISVNPLQIKFWGHEKGMDISLEEISEFGDKDEMNTILTAKNYNI